MNLKTFAGGIAAALIALSASSASAVTADFVAEAAGNERAVVDGTAIDFSGLIITFSSSSGFAYFDDLAGGKPAGLGECNTLTTNCGGEDNIGPTIDDVSLSFGTLAQKLDITGFTDSGHNPIDLNKTLLLGLNGAAAVSKTFGEVLSTTFTNISSIEFGFGGQDPSEFYVNGLTAVIPIPPALLLFGTALGGMGLLARRKKKAA